MKREVIKFHSKITRILSFFLLLTIPAFVIGLIYSFNIYALFGIIVISILFILIVIWVNCRGVILEEDKIIFLEFSKKVILLENVESLNLGRNGCIIISYNGKITQRAGYIDFLSKLPNEEKNEEVIKKINDLRKARKGKNEKIFCNKI